MPGSVQDGGRESWDPLAPAGRGRHDAGVSAGGCSRGVTRMCTARLQKAECKVPQWGMGAWGCCKDASSWVRGRVAVRIAQGRGGRTGLGGGKWPRWEQRSQVSNLCPLHHLIRRPEAFLHQRSDVLRLELQLLPDEVHLHGELQGGGSTGPGEVRWGQDPPLLHPVGPRSPSPRGAAPPGAWRGSAAVHSTTPSPSPPSRSPPARNTWVKHSPARRCPTSSYPCAPSPPLTSPCPAPPTASGWPCRRPQRRPHGVRRAARCPPRPPLQPLGT